MTKSELLAELIRKNARIADLEAELEKAHARDDDRIKILDAHDKLLSEKDAHYVELVGLRLKVPGLEAKVNALSERSDKQEKLVKGLSGLLWEALR